jgi:superfamily II DNA or RNA helicase
MKENNIVLRDYQEKVIQEMNTHFNQEKIDNGILVIPTGGGKTITAAYFLHQQFKSGKLGEDSIVLWLTHNIDLLEQTHNSFKKFFEPSNMAVVSSVHSSFDQIRNDKVKLKNLEVYLLVIYPAVH